MNHSPEKGSDKTSKKAGEEVIEAATVVKNLDAEEAKHEPLDPSHYVTASTAEKGTIREDTIGESVDWQKTSH